MTGFKSYNINGMIRLTMDFQTIEIKDVVVQAYSEKQALLVLTLDLASQYGYNSKWLYKMVLRSKLKVKEI